MGDDPDPVVAPPVPDAAALAGLLADDHRRRVVAALVLGAATLDEARSATGLDTRSAAVAVARLVDGELVERDPDGRLVLLAAAFGRAAVAAAADRDAEVLLGVAGGAAERVDADDAKVLRVFLRNGRLTSIPTNRTKLLVILDHVAQRFEPGRRYTEGEVGALLREVHDDVAALRRHLVDFDFLERQPVHGRPGQPTRVEYWRTGGTVAPG